MPDDRPYRPQLFVPRALATTASRFPPVDRFSQGLQEAMGGSIPEATPAPHDVIESASRLEDAEKATLTPIEPEKEPSSPSHSAEELEAAKKEAYRKGYDAGVDEFHKQQRDAERQHQNAFMAALAEIDKLVVDLREREERAESDAAALLREAFRRFYVRIDETAKERALLLCRALEESADADVALRRPSGVEIYLNPDDVEAFLKFVGEKDATASLVAIRECRVIPSEKVRRGEAEMRWIHGGMSVSPKRIADAFMEATE
ncbi:MAG: hypothetical protein ABW189_09550 [Rickettsiales bacterium]